MVYNVYVVNKQCVQYINKWLLMVYTYKDVRRFPFFYESKVIV